MEEDDEADEEMKKSLEGPFDEYSYNIYNPMHYILVQEQPFVHELGLDTLVEVVPLVAIGNTLQHIQKFINYFSLLFEHTIENQLTHYTYVFIGETST